MYRHRHIAVFNRLQRLAVDAMLSGFAFFVVTILPVLQNERADLNAMALLLTCYLGASVPALYLMRTYRSIWRYTSFRDFLRLVAASALTVMLFLVAAAVILGPMPPVSGALVIWTVLLIFFVNIGTLVAPRFLVRALDEILSWNRSGVDAVAGETRDILVTGDVSRVEAFIRECARDNSSRYRIVGVIASDARLYGSNLQGVRILGTLEELGTVLERLAHRGLRPSTLVVAPGGGSSHVDYSKLLELTRDYSIRIARLPALGTIAEPIEVKDLLGRAEIKIDIQAVASMIEGNCVMVTGGGGSIGGELCRQIARLNPSRLVVLDSGEFNLYAIDAELASRHPDMTRETALVDVRDAGLVSHWIGRTHPAIVFHAAALKHVPLIEGHPLEGIKTNVFGTISVAEACRAHRVPVMVMISTDKAVNPTNVMGATKRLAEAYCQGLDLARDAAAVTRFIMVRFGNVLDSAGSVVPLFRHQIEVGGPVTVTHPDVTRYFMTIPEAVTLVMMAGAQGIGEVDDRGHIYLLDMGRPVKIVDLAREMIRLSGRRPDIDIRIEFIGLRPGEKLFEELSYTEETVQPTRSQAIFKLDPRATDLRIIRQQVQELRQACANEDRERALRLLKISVPDYRVEPDCGSASQS